MNTKHVLLGLVLAFGVPSFGCGSDAKKDKDESAESDKSDKKDKKKDEKEKDKGEKASGSATAAATAAPGGGTTAPAAVAGSAFSHLPGDCQVAVTMDLGKTLAHPAFQKEVAPLLEEIVSAPSPKDEDFKKFQAFVQKTGTSPKSVKTVGICVKGISAGNEGDWGFVLGGDFKPDSIVAALEEHKDATDKVIDVDGRKALTSDKATVGQFGDASIGLAKTLDIFKSLAGTNDHATTLYKMDTTKEIAFAAAESLIVDKIKNDPKTPEPFKGLKKVSGFADLASNKVVMRLTVGAPDEATKLNALLILMKDEFAKKPSSNTFGEGDALKSATSRIEGNDVVIEATFPPTALDGAAKLLAGELKKAKTKL